MGTVGTMVMDPALANFAILAALGLVVARAAGRRGRSRAGWFALTLVAAPVGLLALLWWVVADRAARCATRRFLRQLPGGGWSRVIAPRLLTGEWRAFFGAYGREAGLALERRTGARLRRDLGRRSRDYAVLDAVSLRPHDDIDHVVVGPAGVFVVEAKLWRDLHVLAADRVWQRYGPTATDGFRGPNAQFDENVRLLDRFLRDRGLSPGEHGVRGVLLWGHPASEVWVAREARDCPILRVERIAPYIAARRAGTPLTRAQIAAVVDAVRPYATR